MLQKKINTCKMAVDHYKDKSGGGCDGRPLFIVPKRRAIHAVIEEDRSARIQLSRCKVRATFVFTKIESEVHTTRRRDTRAKVPETNVSTRASDVLKEIFAWTM